MKTYKTEMNLKKVSLRVKYSPKTDNTVAGTDLLKYTYLNTIQL